MNVRGGKLTEGGAMDVRGGSLREGLERDDDAVECTGASPVRELPAASLLVSALLGIDDSPSLLRLWCLRGLWRLRAILYTKLLLLSGSLPISSCPSGSSPAIPAAWMVVVKLRALFSGPKYFYDGRANADPASNHFGLPPDRVLILGLLSSFCAVCWPVQSRHSINIVSQVPRHRRDRCAR